MHVLLCTHAVFYRLFSLIIRGLYTQSQSVLTRNNRRAVNFPFLMPPSVTPVPHTELLLIKIKPLATALPELDLPLIFLPLTVVCAIAPTFLLPNSPACVAVSKLFTIASHDLHDVTKLLWVVHTLKTN